MRADEYPNTIYLQDHLRDSPKHEAPWLGSSLQSVALQSGGMPHAKLKHLITQQLQPHCCANHSLEVVNGGFT